MAKILEVAAVQHRLAALPVETYQAGATVLAADTTTGRLLILREGAVEVVKDGVRIGEVAEPGRCSASSRCCWISRTRRTYAP